MDIVFYGMLFCHATEGDKAHVAVSCCGGRVSAVRFLWTRKSAQCHVFHGWSDDKPTRNEVSRSIPPCMVGGASGAFDSPFHAFATRSRQDWRNGNSLFHDLFHIIYISFHEHQNASSFAFCGKKHPVAVALLPDIYSCFKTLPTPFFIFRPHRNLFLHRHRDHCHPWQSPYRARFRSAPSLSVLFRERESGELMLMW